MSQNGASPQPPRSGPLDGLRVLDLSRILAGPTCTQLLGDLGADIIKIERPGRGDDTRGWGPPFLDAQATTSGESAYFLSCNRNKRSVAVDISTDAGQAIIRALARHSDIVVENFKPGDLVRYGLDHESLRALNPRLIYCSISGFGQTGPYREQSGYDFLIQGMGGIMSITGFPDEAGGQPTKVGVGIADVMCGMYAAVAVLSALEARRRTGEGQHIDLALFDSQIAWLINQGVAYLVSGEEPVRLGNGHPHIVPYETFPTADGHFILAVGNDAQFTRFCQVAGCEELARDARFATNAGRVRHRQEIVGLIAGITRGRAMHDWISALHAAGVPCGPVNSISQVFADPHALARGMRITMPHQASATGSVDLIGNPLNFAQTPVSYRRPPPRLGEHTREILREVLGMDDGEIGELESASTISMA